MNLCDDGHNVVAYDSKNCPVCEAISELERGQNSLIKKVEELEAEIENLKSEEKNE